MPEYDWEYIRPLAEGGQARIALYRKKGDVAGRLYIGKSALKPELAPYVKREHSILERLIRSGFQYAVDEDCSGPGGYTSYRRYYEGVNLQEFIEGKDGIPNFFREGTDASERFLTFAYRLSNLVYHLHEEMEYVHRDIKPKNVIYGRDGIVALIDLGIAKKIGDSGNSEGTPGWADPQQLLPGQVVTTSHDLYSLAKTFIWSLGLSPEEKSIKQRKPSWMMRNKSAAQFLELCLDCITKVNAGRPSVMDLLSALRRAQAVGDRRKKVYDTCPNPDCGVSTPVKAPFCFSCLTPLLLEQPTGICGLCNKEIPLDRMARHYREYHPDSDAITSGAYHPTAGRGKKIYVCNNCEWTTQDSNLYKIHKSVCQDRDKLLKPPRLDFRPIDRFEQWKEISTNPRALFGFSDSGIRFESLEVYRSLDIKFYEHQEDAVLRALRDLGGRCIIADSVGLGKTIECGIILRELIYRDEVESVLILVPNYELQDQWLEELEEKFELGPGSEFGFRKWRVTDPAPKRGSKVIAEFKHALERRTLPHDKSCKSCDFFGPEKIHWDAIIVDEAHELGLNYKGIRWQQLLKMDPRYLFLVTATPIRNDPVNLYPLILAINPLLAGKQSDFARSYQRGKASAQDFGQLKGLLSQVMIRHTRGDVPSIQFPKRNAVEHFAPLHDADERLEECLRILAKESGKTGRIAKLLYKKFRQSILELVSYLYERESSDDPGRETLRYLRRKSKERALVATKAAFEWLLHRTGAIWKLGLSPEQDPKLQALIHVLGEHWKKHESTKGILEFLQPSELPVIVFTAENSGRDIIAAQLRRHFPEQRIEGFTDNMKGPQRKELLANFNEGRVDVLVCATSQSRGLNLQYGSILINMDLPVSPVELEQRIGRVQRLGQDKPIVHIVNIMYEIESERWLWEGYKEYLMMFQEVLGDTDLISIFTASDTPKRVEEIYQSIISGELNHQQTKLKFKEAAEEMKRAVESHRQSLRRESDDDEPPVIP